MSRIISRRTLLRNGLSAGAGVVVFSQLHGPGRLVMAASANSQRTAERFQPAYKRLDEFITQHMRETGAPGMTLALADRQGLLRTSQYGFADLKAGVKVGPQTLFEILEAVDKRPFPDVLYKRVLEPLGMTASAPMITNAIKESRAIGYVPLHEDRPFPLGGKLAEAPWLEVPEAAGSIASAAGDMAAYLQMLLNNGVGPRGRVISEKSFQLLIKPVITAPFRGEAASYGYGLWTSDLNNRTLVRHTGGMVAFSSAMYADLTDGFAAFASVNANMRSYRPVAVTRYALDLLHAASRNQDLPSLPVPQSPPDSIKNASDYGLRTIAEVTRACNAGGGCRSCYSLIEDILGTVNNEW